MGAYALVSLANAALYQTGTGRFDAGADTIPLRHTWSLSVEEQFYPFFAPTGTSLGLTPVWVGLLSE